MSARVEGVRRLVSSKNMRNAVNQQTANGTTPLQLAVKQSHSLAAKCLVEECGASIDVTDPQGRTLLMIAASNGTTDIINMLLKEGQPIKAQDNQGRTALQYACNKDVVLILEKALEHVTVYREVFEINLQQEVKRGAEGQVLIAKHNQTGDLLALKFHKRSENRDRSADIMEKLAVGSRAAHKLIALPPPGMIKNRAEWCVRVDGMHRLEAAVTVTSSRWLGGRCSGSLSW